MNRKSLRRILASEGLLPKTASSVKMILDYLGGSMGFVPEGLTVSDLVLGFGGKPQQHTRILQRMVQEGLLAYDRKRKEYRLP